MKGMNLLTTDEAAAMIKVSRRTIYQLIKTGQLKAHQHKRRSKILFDFNQLTEYIK